MTWTQNKIFLPQHPQPIGKRQRSYDAMLALLQERGPQTQTYICEQLAFSSTKVSEMLRYGRERGDLQISGKGERGKYLIGVVQ